MTKRRYRRSWHERWGTVRQWLLEDQANKGLGGPPNHWRTTGYFITGERKLSTTKSWYRCSISLSFVNDASEIWIAKKDEQEKQADFEKWMFSCRAEHFRRMALWYLWRWAWGEWFGLRRWLYYKDLHRRCERFGQHIAKVAKAELERQWGRLVKEKQDAAK